MKTNSLKLIVIAGSAVLPGQITQIAKDGRVVPWDRKKKSRIAGIAVSAANKNERLWLLTPE